MDIRAMRERLEEQIRRLQEDLRALARVEEMQTQLARNGNGSTPAPTKTQRRGRRRRSPTTAVSAADAIKEAAARAPDRHWTTVHMDEELQRAGYRAENFNRSNIGVTLRRLREEGLFELVSSSHKEGNVYRWKGK